MRTIEIDIIEKLLFISEKIRKYGDDNVFNKSGITILQFNILGVVVSKKGVTIKDLKTNLIVSSASLSQTINRMEKSGFLERSLGKGDRREIWLKATKSGEDLYNKLYETYTNEANKKFKKIANEKKKIILDSLNLIDKLV